MIFSSERFRKLFFKRVVKTDSCWIWASNKDRDGYGQIACMGRVSKAHRASFAMANGYLISGMVVMHSCDRPECVNPDHLSLGTHADNAADKVKKLRHGHLDSNSQSVLTSDDANTIRAAYLMGMKLKDAADLYGVTRQCIGEIVNGRNWVSV